MRNDRDRRNDADAGKVVRHKTVDALMADLNAPDSVTDSVSVCKRYILNPKGFFGSSLSGQLLNDSIETLIKAATTPKPCENCDDRDADVWVKCHDKLFDENKALKQSCEKLVEVLEKIAHDGNALANYYSYSVAKEALSDHRAREVK